MSEQAKVSNSGRGLNFHNYNVKLGHFDFDIECPPGSKYFNHGDRIEVAYLKRVVLFEAHGSQLLVQFVQPKLASKGNSKKTYKLQEVPKLIDEVEYFLSENYGDERE